MESAVSGTDGAPGIPRVGDDLGALRADGDGDLAFPSAWV
jgi:hypothetical protein